MKVFTTSFTTLYLKQYSNATVLILTIVECNDKTRLGHDWIFANTLKSL